MENKFAKNDKFLSLNGVLYRRDFLVNIFKIKIVESLIWIAPCLYFIFLNPLVLLDFKMDTINQSYPFWFVLWECLTGLVMSVFYFSSFVRRIRDITELEDNQKVYLISAILAVLVFMVYTPAGHNTVGTWIFLIINIFLLTKKGKISSQAPKDEVIKFNWGAFLGTWIWGLTNNVKRTLLIIPLTFAFCTVPAMLICGLKGNQWAFEKSENKDDIEAFHKNQSKQTKIWIFCFPVLVFVLMFLSGLSLYGAKIVFAHSPNAIQLINDYSEVAVKTTFDTVEKNGDKYEFYISPAKWQMLNDKKKKNCLSLAFDYTKIKEKNNSYDKVYIYSSFNKELLGKMKSEDDIFLNNHPSLP